MLEVGYSTHFWCTITAIFPNLRVLTEWITLLRGTVQWYQTKIPLFPTLFISHHTVCHMCPHPINVYTSTFYFIFISANWTLLTWFFGLWTWILQVHVVYHATAYQPLFPFFQVSFVYCIKHLCQSVIAMPHRRISAGLACTMERSILTLNRLAHDQSGVWPNRGAGQITDEILQTARDPVSLGSQSQVCL
jgi:hypothetical protein